MTFLDSSVIIHYLDGSDAIVEYVDDETSPPYFTSSLCVYEVLMGEVHAPGETDLHAQRERFSWVQSLELNERIAIQAAQLQDRLRSSGELMTPRDVLIAATARSTGDLLVVADADFEVDDLDEFVPVSNLL
jgi:predicted nucleic acid-binding protein